MISVFRCVKTITGLLLILNACYSVTANLVHHPAPQELNFHLAFHHQLRQIPTQASQMHSLKPRPVREMEIRNQAMTAEVRNLRC